MRVPASLFYEWEARIRSWKQGESTVFPEQLAAGTWRAQLRRQGYIHFKHIVSADLIAAAHDVIDEDLRHNFDETRREEYDSLSYCPDIRDAPPLAALIDRSPLHGMVDEVLDWSRLERDAAQIAIQHGNPNARACRLTPHLDGFAYGKNRRLPGRIYNFTVNIGVFLSDTSAPYRGNLAVWPQSHLAYESYFRDRGRQAEREPMPAPAAIGRPVQLICSAGDAVWLPFHMGHAVAPSISAGERRVAYFRLYLRDIEADRWRYLTNCWEGWRS